MSEPNTVCCPIPILAPFHEPRTKHDESKLKTNKNEKRYCDLLIVPFLSPNTHSDAISQTRNEERIYKKEELVKELNRKLKTTRTKKRN
ncbi:hypothetical protein C2G38_2155930 [Gigaspora rosea]|uniref:Uncharacterized protein n=1 Tax=Gigaspora rosea TaxID=44941 RepID=A0A397W558_9GLOM|nr:hypothetical protein C2G38_2155930 [Gigaspora rosea]